MDKDANLSFPYQSMMDKGSMNPKHYAFPNIIPVNLADASKLLPEWTPKKNLWSR